MTCITLKAENRHTTRHHQGETPTLRPGRQNRYTDPLHTASAERRHTAAYRMARDPAMPICDVRWVLGHAQLSTTQVYLSPLPEDVIAGVLAHHERRAQQQPQAPAPARYRPESLNVLFGTDR